MSDPVPGALSIAQLHELNQLAGALREGVITNEQVARLDQLLSESPAAMTAFADLLAIVAELRLHRAGTGCQPVATAARPGLARLLPRRALWPLASAAGIVLLAAVAWLTWPLTHAPGEIVARIVRSSGARLEVNGTTLAPPLERQDLGVGRYALVAGILEVEMAQGARLILEAPARFALSSANQVVLQAGNLSARVPERAVGFRVETPTASVIDLGTEFGVSVGATSSEVHVFKGEVLIQNPNDPDSLRLTQNRASRIDLATRTPTGIDYQPERFLRSLDEPTSNYRDLIRQFDPVAYYRMRITPEANRLIDVSAQHLHGQIILGASQRATGPGKIGAGLRLGGPSARSYAVVPDFPKAPAAALTVCAWVRAESRPRWASIAKNWAKDGPKNLGGQFHFGLWHDEGSLEIHVHDAEGREVGVRDSVPLPLGEWQFVAFTLDGATLRLYRNGQEVASAPCTSLSRIAPSTLGLGAKLDGGVEPERNTPGFWDGTLDELAIFHRALNAAEILSLYDAAR